MFKQAVFYRFWGAFLFLAALLLASCSGRRIAATLDDVETFIQERPDSALTVLRSLDTSALASRSLRAHYALLHAMALDKNWIDTTDENVIMPAVAYYDRHRNLDRRARAYYYLGRIQYNGHRYDEAIISYILASRWSTNLEDNRFKALIFHAMGDTYGSTSLYEEALSFSDSAYVFSLKAEDTLLANASRFRIAQTLNNLKRYREADSLYRLLIADSLVTSDAHLYPRVLSGYAMTVLGLDNNCEKARALFEQCLDVGRFESYNHWGAYAYSLAVTGNMKKAQQITASLRNKGLEDTFSYQGWNSRIEFASGNQDNAYVLLLNALDKQSESSRKALRQSVIKAQLDYTDAQNRLLVEKASARKTLSLLIIFILVAVAIVIWQWIHNQMRKAEEEKESMLETISKLTELRVREPIADKYVEVYRTYLQQMGTIRDMLRESHTEEGAERLIQRLKTMMQNLRLDKIRQGEFEAMMNREFDDVMTHYREEYPGANESDYLIVCYLFAGFDGSTICTLAGLPSKQAVYSRKSRLRQKIQSGNAPHREQFLRMLS